MTCPHCQSPNATRVRGVIVRCDTCNTRYVSPRERSEPYAHPAHFLRTMELSRAHQQQQCPKTARRRS